MPSPVKHTCPDIDSVIKGLKDIQTEAKQGMRDNDKGEDNYQRFKDIEWNIDFMIDTMEELRSVNSELRGYGEDMETEKVSREVENERLEEKLNDLKKEYSRLEIECENLRQEIEMNTNQDPVF
jgi:predicted nuclease with TOPRIM domain